MSNGYVHSVKVPRLYKCIADIVRRVREDGANLKSLIYEAKHTNTSAIFGLSMSTLRAFSQLDQLLENTKILVEQPRLDPWLARVLITELLWGKKKLQSEAKPIQTVLAYTDKLREEVKNLECPKPVISHKDKAHKPRYVRINTLLLSVEEAIYCFQEEGWELLPRSTTYTLYLQTVSRLSKPFFIQDFHIPEVLTFPSGTLFYDHPGYHKGKLLLQDKASCLPVHLLNPDVGSIVLDTCAAPGMKATYIAAKLKNIGTVYAVEIDTTRFKALVQLVEKTKSSCVLSINQDVLILDPKQYSSVEYILVDPSCSGSGIVDRPEESNMVGRTDTERLKNLQSIQVYLLRYALFNFPKAKKIIYSTCSIHPEENEEVIDEVLADIGDAYRLIPVKQLLPNWANFSSEQYHCGDRCLYARSDIDFCNGFFVAVFERNFDVPIPECTRKGGNACSVEADPDVKRDKEAKEVSHQKKRGRNKNTEELLTTGKVRDVESVPQAVNEAKPNKRRKKLQETDACFSTNLNHEEVASSKSEDIQKETEDMGSKKSKKKKKSKHKDMPDIRESNEIMEANKDMENEPTKKKKKKKKGNKEDEKLYVTQKEEQDETESLTKKKQITDAIHIDNSEGNKEREEKKKKKQKKKERNVNQGQIEEESVELQKKKKRKRTIIENEDPIFRGSKRLNVDF